MVDSRIRKRMQNQNSGRPASPAVHEKNKRSGRPARTESPAREESAFGAGRRKPDGKKLSKAIRKPGGFKPGENRASSQGKIRKPGAAGRNPPPAKTEAAGRPDSGPEYRGAKANQRVKSPPKSDAYKKYAANIRKSKIGRGMFLAVTMFLLFFLVSAMIYELFFKITEIEVDGLTKYREDEIIRVSGAEMGKNIYSFSASEACEMITDRCPFIKSVTVERSLPNKVTLVVTEERAVFYANIFGENYLFSESMRVLGKASGEQDTDGMIKLKLPLINYAVAGSDIQFLEIQNDKYIRSATSDVIRSPMAERINLINLKDRYNVTMVADGRYRLLFGTTEEVLLKLKLAEKVFQDSMFATGNKAIVDLTNLNETSVIIDNAISLD